jgi:hypothetical protein
MVRRAFGKQTQQIVATANEALALLPSFQPGSVKPQVRKLLEIEANATR